MLDLLAQPGTERQHLLGGHDAVERVEHPDDGAFGDEGGGEDAVAGPGIDEPERGVGVDHGGEPLSSGRKPRRLILT
ncbi:hypothetical protein D3C78_1709410 [compost metagenome]